MRFPTKEAMFKVYWMDNEQWFTIDDEGIRFKEGAPQDVIDSYNLWNGEITYELACEMALEYFPTTLAKPYSASETTSGWLFWYRAEDVGEGFEEPSVIVFVSRSGSSEDVLPSSDRGIELASSITKGHLALPGRWGGSMACESGDCCQETHGGQLARVRELALNVDDSYEDFVKALVRGCKEYGVSGDMIKFMENHPKARTDNVLLAYYKLTILK